MNTGQLIQLSQEYSESVRRMAELVARIDGPFISLYNRADTMHIFNHSTSRSPSRKREREIHAVRILGGRIALLMREISVKNTIGCGIHI